MSITTQEHLSSLEKNNDEVEATFKGTAFNTATGDSLTLTLLRAYRWTLGRPAVVFVLRGSDGETYSFSIEFRVFDPASKIYDVKDPEIRGVDFYESSNERYFSAESGTVDLKNEVSQRELTIFVKAVTMEVLGVKYKLDLSMTTKGPFQPVA
ncbi:hypothetical protein ABHN98_01575 [Pseudomonas syringae]